MFALCILKQHFINQVQVSETHFWPSEALSHKRKALINFCSIHLSSDISPSLPLALTPSVPSLLALCHFHRLLWLERFSLLRPSLLGNPSAACNEMDRIRGRERCRDTCTKILTEREMEQDGDAVRRKLWVPVWSFAGLQVIYLSSRFKGNRFIRLRHDCSFWAININSRMENKFFWC